MLIIRKISITKVILHLIHPICNEYYFYNMLNDSETSIGESILRYSG